MSIIGQIYLHPSFYLSFFPRMIELHADALITYPALGPFAK